MNHEGAILLIPLSISLPLTHYPSLTLSTPHYPSLSSLPRYLINPFLAPTYALLVDLPCSSRWKNCSLLSGSLSERSERMMASFSASNSFAFSIGSISIISRDSTLLRFFGEGNGFSVKMTCLRFHWCSTLSVWSPFPPFVNGVSK